GVKVPGAKTVTYGGPAYYYHLATAGVWVFDTRQEPWLIKRKETLYIQTWHGTPLKKLGLDIDELHMAAETGKDEYAEAIRAESRKWDILVSPNSFSTAVFKRCFAYDGEILECGYPRNDKLVRARKGSRKVRDKVCERLGIAKDKKILLYAPTWRDDEYLGGGWYRYGSPLGFEELESKLGMDFVVILKTHYLVKLDGSELPGRCLESGFLKVCGSDIDITSLYIAADALITDYSSVMFDYSVLGRPMFFFTYDLERYREHLRGFYFDFEQEAPGPLSESTEKLADDIVKCFDAGDKDAQPCGEADGPADPQRADESQPHGANERFARFCEKYCHLEDGKASARVAARIEEFITKGRV
ncbi:MAG: CDP-glycerol glycerophosphotransferase family protein, partial [Lachnospiraceae bacterium]|nr:CDP-glycerol glycerophosphotransferase family protein [Lachnospiraceae bacterium]